jgi:predicted DNA-binding transcriptional regulator AlpA
MQGSYTKREVAEILQASERSVDRWAKEDVIPAPVRLKRSVRWNKALFDEWFGNRSRGEVGSSEKERSDFSLN